MTQPLQPAEPTRQPPQEPPLTSRALFNLNANKNLVLKGRAVFREELARAVDDIAAEISSAARVEPDILIPILQNIKLYEATYKRQTWAIGRFFRSLFSRFNTAGNIMERMDGLAKAISRKLVADEASYPLMYFTIAAIGKKEDKVAMAALFTRSLSKRPSAQEKQAKVVTDAACDPVTNLRQAVLNNDLPMIEFLVKNGSVADIQNAWESVKHERIHPRAQGAFEEHLPDELKGFTKKL